MDILFFLFGLLTFIFVIATFVKIKNSDRAFLSSLSRNWAVNPIYDISTFSPNLPCNYLITDSWPGTVESCYSKSILYVGPGRCRTGRRILGLDPIPYYAWRNTTICAQKYSTNYFKLSISEHEMKCPKGERSCGIIDTYGNFLCVETNKPCPINYIRIIPDNQKITPEFNKTSIKLKDSTLYYSNENIKGKIILETQISEDTPCMDSSHKNYLQPPFQTEFFYGYDQCVNPVFDKLYDDSYSTIDSYSYYQVYKEIGVLDLLQTVPTFPDYALALQRSTNRNFKLFTKNYIGLTGNCYSEIKNRGVSDVLIADLGRVSSNIDYANSKCIGALICACLMFFFVLASLGAVWGCAMADPNWKTGGLNALCRIYIEIPAALLSIGVLIYAIIIMVNISGVGDNFVILSQIECFRSDINPRVVDGINSIFSVKDLAVKFLIFSVLTLLSYAMLWVPLFTNICGIADGLKEMENENNQNDVKKETENKVEGEINMNNKVGENELEGEIKMDRTDILHQFDKTPS